MAFGPEFYRNTSMITKLAKVVLRGHDWWALRNIPRLQTKSRKGIGVLKVTIQYLLHEIHSTNKKQISRWRRSTSLTECSAGMFGHYNGSLLITVTREEAVEE